VHEISLERAVFIDIKKPFNKIVTATFSHFVTQQSEGETSLHKQNQTPGNGEKNVGKSVSTRITERWDRTFSFLIDDA